MSDSHCPICRDQLATQVIERPNKDALDYNCPNCGVVSLSRSLVAVLEGPSYDDRRRAVLSYAVRKVERKDDRPLFTTEFAAAVVDRGYLPGIEEQLENLVLYLGKALPEAGATIGLDASAMRATLGCIAEGAAGWLLKQAYEADLIQGIPRGNMSTAFGMLDATLSFRGWDEYAKILSAGKRSKRAFMAMQFGDFELDKIFLEHFKPASKLAGFDLVRIDEEPSAGLIDDRLRVEIKRSRFLIADLSHGNKGAYWEAGYAEGLGRPVIYTCRKDVFNNGKEKPHFDTNHHLTIIWDAVNPTLAAKQLTAAIRVTIPGEAKLSDD